MPAGKIDMKIVMLGKEGVGKTCLVQKYLHDMYSETANYQATIGAAFGAKRVVINGQPIVMGIWDTAGSERYEAMSRIYYRGAKAAIICYDITDQTSFARLRFWVGELQKNESECKIYLCGTKMDIAEDDSKVRQVDVHDARDFADEIHSRLFETSSKTGENIGALFQQIAEDYAENLKDQAVLKKSTVEIRTSSAKPASHCPC